VAQAWIGDGSLTVANGERGFRLDVRPESESEIRVAVADWYKLPESAKVDA